MPDRGACGFYLVLCLQSITHELLGEAGADPERETAPFFCECSDPDCRRRIRITPHRWNGIHDNPRDFVVAPGHQSPDVERVVESFPGYLVVRKDKVTFDR